MFDTPHAAGNPSPTADYIQPNFGHALRIWWALFWRSTLVGGILGIGLGLLVGRLYQYGDLPLGAVAPTARYGGYVLNYAVAFFVMYYVLHKTFRRFRVALVENWCEPNAQILEPTLARSSRIWWTYTWRTVVYTLVVYVAAYIPLSVVTGFLSLGPAVGSVLVLLFGSVVIPGVAALFAIYSNILDEDFGNFRVTIAPRSASVPGAEIVATATNV
jgi:hypothetical protein